MCSSAPSAQQSTELSLKVMEKQPSVTLEYDIYHI